MSKYFGTDGFRGEANKALNVEHAYKIGRFLGAYYGREHKCSVVIGKDTRRSGYMFECALTAGLTASGADAYLMHVTTTPSVSYITRTDDFDYELPDELIAQAPAEPRDSCRLLVLHRGEPLAKTGDVEVLPSGGSIEHKHFYDIIDYIEPGDVLVINKTRVMPARLIGRKPTGGVAETLLLRRREDIDAMGHVWECLVNPGKRLKPGAVIEYCAGGAHAPESAPVVLTGEVIDFVPESRGGRLVRFTPEGEAWRQQMLRYVESNVELVEAFLRRYIPSIRVVRPEASFLVWLDCRQLGLAHDALTGLFVNGARLALNDGELFGPGGEGHMRLNVGLPRVRLHEALERLRMAVSRL